MNLEQDHLRKLLNNLHIPVLEFDLDFRLVYFNNAALKFLKYDISILDSHLHVDDLVASEFTNLVHTGLNSLLEGAEPSSISIRAVRSDGVEVPIEVFCNVISVDSSKCGFIAYILDMTRRVRIEEKLEDTREFLDLVIEHAYAGIFLVNDKYSFDYVNDRFCEILNRTRSEILGHDFREFLHPDSVQLVGERYIRRQRGEDVPKTYSFKILQKDGTERDVQITSVTMQSRDRSIKTVAQLIDITEETEGRELLKQSEHKYRSLVETMADGLAVDDENGQIIYANDALAKMMGLEKGEQIVGFRDGDVLNGYSNDVLEKRYTDRRMGTTERYDTYLKHRSGRLVPVIVSASPYFDINGEFVGTFAIFSDISELRDAEAEARFLLDLLMHDIGNQLQLILAGSDLCNKESSLEVVEGAQQYVRDGAQRCLDLITKIRRSEEAKDQPLFLTDLIPVLKGEINLLKRLYDIEVETLNLPESVMIFADGALSQLIWNLMENAVKHNPKEEKRIWIEGTTTDDTFKLSIADNGKGLGPAERTQIFDEVRRFGGVGLHIVRQLVLKYGAKLRAEDRVNGYTNEGLKIIITFCIVHEPSE